MFSKNSLLGLLTVPLTYVLADGAWTDTFALPRDGVASNQVAMHSMGDPSVPVLKNVTISIPSGDDSITRAFLVSVPDTKYTMPAEGWPLIVDFHGRDGSAEGQCQNSQYYLYPEGQEYVVVYPYGCWGRANEDEDGKPGHPERAWEGAYYADKSCNDILFVSTLLNHIIKDSDLTIDTTRVFASGKSNGGGFVDTLACSEIRGSFAAFAMASAALYTEVSHGHDFHDRHQDPYAGVGPQRILEAHGSNDPTIPMTGKFSSRDGRLMTPEIPRWARTWARRNQCSTEIIKDTEPVDTDWGTSTTYSCGSPSQIVQQLTVTDLGHCWPSIRKNTDITKPDHSTVPCKISGLDFTQTVLDFFAASADPQYLE